MDKSIHTSLIVVSLALLSTTEAFSANDIPLTDPLQSVQSMQSMQSMQQPGELALNGPWLYADGLSDNAMQLIQAIKDVRVHGLNPEHYGLTSILGNADSLARLDRSLTHASQRVDSEHLPDSINLRDELTLQLDTAFRELIRDLGHGAVDASAKLYRDVPQVPEEDLLYLLHTGKLNVTQAIDSVIPAHADYLRLTSHMRNLLTERSTGIPRTVIQVSGPAEGFQNALDILEVTHRLVESGDLTPGTLLTPVLDDQLSAAIKSLQTRHGLIASGTIDIRTRKALDLSIDEEIEAVALSLERLRWMPADLGFRHLYVNIPDYSVMLREGMETRMSMDVVVGAVQHRTPSFSRDMSYMELNPTWTVPRSITNNKLIPLERKKPGYLQSQNFEFLKNVNDQLVVVPPEQISAADLQRPSFPYVLRQRAGDNNALGRMKFMMPNPYSIYLHDTQDKELFKKNERAFSHGCIRLSEPDTLARVLLGNDGYDSRFIEQSLKSGKTSQVKFRSPIPTHTVYMTTWVDESGTLQRRSDIYGHDAALKSAMQASDTLLTILDQPADMNDVPALLASNPYLPGNRHLQR